MNIQERMELLKTLSKAVQDTIRGGWMDTVDFREEDHRIRWMADGTGVVEAVSASGGRGPEILRFQVEVTCSAVEPAPVANEPNTWQKEERPWSSIPAGWFIQDPKGAWWEILETARVGTGQRVAMRCGSMRGEWIRPLKQHVVAAPGTLAPEIQGAVDALGSAFHVDVLGDQIS